MITINGNNYKLCLIDTNVVSEILKHPDVVYKRISEKLNPGIYIPCFSLYTILELRQKKQIYEKFLKLFSLLPCMVLKSLDQLFQEELKSYPNPGSISPILVTCPGAFVPEKPQLKDLMQSTFSHTEVNNLEKRLNLDKKEILEGMLNLVRNYPPKGNKYTDEEIFN